MTIAEQRELNLLRAWAFDVSSDENFIEFEEDFYSSPQYARLEELMAKEKAEKECMKWDTQAVK